MRERTTNKSESNNRRTIGEETWKQTKPNNNKTTLNYKHTTNETIIEYYQRTYKKHREMNRDEKRKT